MKITGKHPYGIELRLLDVTARSYDNSVNHTLVRAGCPLDTTVTDLVQVDQGTTTFKFKTYEFVKTEQLTRKVTNPLSPRLSSFSALRRQMTSAF